MDVQFDCFRTVEFFSERCSFQFLLKDSTEKAEQNSGN